MKAPIPRRYFLIPVVYLILIAGLLTMEFSGTAKIEERLHNLSITAVVPAAERGNPGALEKLLIDMDGFVLDFDKRNPLEFRLASGGSIYANLTGYAILTGSVEVNFGERLRLVFFAGGGSQNRLEIRTDIKESAELFIPYSSLEKTQIEVIEGLPMLTVSRSGRHSETVTAVALQDSSTIDSGKGVFILRNGADSFKNIYITRFSNGDMTPIAHWFSLHYEDQDSGQTDSIREDFIEAAYRGWTSSRFYSAAGTWRMAGSGADFDETILASALTEARKRGTFAAAYGDFRSALRLHADEISYVSTPHTGGIVDRGRAIPEIDLERIRQIETFVSEGNAEVFSLPNLLTFIRDRATTPLFQDVAEFASRIDLAAVDPNHAPGMLDVYLESRAFEDPLAAAFDGFRQAADICLLPAVYLTDRGYFITGPEGGIDVKASVRAGAVLSKLGNLENVDLYNRIGDALTVSALRLSESEGLLPAQLSTDERTVISSAGTLYPEAIYPLIAGGSYYPKHISLTNELGNRTWAWTSAENFVAERTGSRITISFEYPVDGTHHFILRGIEPFSFMTFFGIRWVSDPQFQIYGSGWLYDETEKMLYVKITHSRVREELVISYE